MATFVTCEAKKKYPCPGNLRGIVMEIPCISKQSGAKEQRQMHQIRHGSVSHPYLDNPLVTTELAETAAQLETLRVLGNAIRQHRGLLEQRHDYVAKIELTIPTR